jgi:hypothetical protein
MNGASLLEIAEVLGHKTLAMVQRYAHLSEAHTRSVVERMNRDSVGTAPRGGLDFWASATPATFATQARLGGERVLGSLRKCWH